MKIDLFMENALQDLRGKYIPIRASLKKRATKKLDHALLEIETNFRNHGLRKPNLGKENDFERVEAGRDFFNGVGEHIREKESCLCENTFTHRFNLLTTLFLYPINSSLHLEHHLYPQLPWHSLKRFRKWAEENSEYSKLANQLAADSYFSGEKSIVSLSFPKK
jgi:hypothetical protein